MTQPKLLDQYRERLRIKHYSLRMEQAYLHWVRRFIYFHSKRHPAGLGGPEVERFLSHLATEGRVSSSAQNRALAALLFLYREVLGRELPWMDGVVRAKCPARVPVVLSENEVRALLAQLDGKCWLVDVDFERREITVRDGADRAAALAPRSRKGSARARPRGGFRRGLSPVRAVAQISASGTKLRLAIRVSIGQPVRARPGWPSPCRRMSCENGYDIRYRFTRHALSNLG